MSIFSKESEKKLATCDVKLIKIANELIKIMDVTILCGHREEKEQNEAFNSGKSKAKFPHSKHNIFPSKAIDIVPYPIDWNDLKRFERMCGIIEGIASQLGISIRLGRDFKTLKDYPHIELEG